MRMLALTAALGASLVATAFAQSTTTHNPNGQAQNNTPVRQQVQQDLQQAGFTDIKVMPESFLVRAKDKHGNPVMMVINPDSVTAVTGTSGQGSGASTSGSGTTGSTGANGGGSTGSSGSSK